MEKNRRPQIKLLNQNKENSSKRDWKINNYIYLQMNNLFRHIYLANHSPRRMVLQEFQLVI